MRKNVKTVFICAGAELLNLATAILVYHVLGIPLFLDTVFTVAVVFCCGLVPALCVSLGYNFLDALKWAYLTGAPDPFMFLYSICGILIVLSTWLVARREEFRISPATTLLYLFLIAILSSACTVISSGIIDYFHYIVLGIPDGMNPIKEFAESFVRQRFSLLASCILAQIPISFLDRLVSTFSGYGVFLLAERLGGKKASMPQLTESESGSAVADTRHASSPLTSCLLR